VIGYKINLSLLRCNGCLVTQRRQYTFWYKTKRPIWQEIGQQHKNWRARIDFKYRYVKANVVTYRMYRAGNYATPIYSKCLDHVLYGLL